MFSISAEVEEAADELTTLLLDDLGPTVAWYRTELAGRLGLDLRELACLDILRKHGVLPSARIAERCGLGRGGVAAMLRRLERNGHVERVNRPERGQAAEVVLRPHAERDAEIDRARAELRRRLTYLLTDRGVERPEVWHAVASLLHHVVSCLHETTSDRVAATALERRRERSRRARETGPHGW